MNASTAARVASCLESPPHQLKEISMGSVVFTVRPSACAGSAVVSASVALRLCLGASVCAAVVSSVCFAPLPQPASPVPSQPPLPVLKLFPVLSHKTISLSFLGAVLIASILQRFAVPFLKICISATSPAPRLCLFASKYTLSR